MKILIVPDVHGSHEWEVVKEKINEVDKIVFLGDLFDSWENRWPDQGENFKNICDFKRNNMDKVVILLGNHDFSYISGTRNGQKVSGHQHGKVLEIRALLTANLDIIDLAFEADGWVFSHAGFSKTWVEYMKKVMQTHYTKYPKADRNCFDSKEEADKYFDELYKDVIVWDTNQFSVDTLNKCWHELTHIPSDDTFSYAFDELLDWHGCFSGSGDEPEQGPLWIRPNSLLEDAYYSNQVVGHTEYCIDNFAVVTEKNNTIVMTDSQHHSVFGIFDTENPPKAISGNDYSEEFNTKWKTIKKFTLLFSTLGVDYSDEQKIDLLKEEFGDKTDFFFEKYFKT